MLTDQKAIDYFTNSMILAKFNAEVDTAVAKRYHVSAYPTTVLVDKSGEEIDRIVGYLETDEFLITVQMH